MTDNSAILSIAAVCHEVWMKQKLDEGWDD